jgi:hypothetical protein
MKRVILGTLVSLGLVMVAVATAQQRGEFAPQRGPMAAAPTPTTAAAGTELIVLSSTTGDGVQVLTVVDPRQRAVSVYHIELATGKIALKSVRNIQWDLRITDFNNVDPSPQQIQSQLERK